MTTHPEICGLVDGDCPYYKQLQELLKDPRFQGVNLEDTVPQDDCQADCPADGQSVCQSLQEFIKQFGLLPVFDVEVPLFPLQSKVNLITSKVPDSECNARESVQTNTENLPSASKEYPLKKSKSRELRAGRLYVGCECEKRYGLQDSCPRSGCQGSPACLTQPPTCGPSQYCSAKHLIKKMKPNWRANMSSQGQKFSVRL